MPAVPAPHGHAALTRRQWAALAFSVAVFAATWIAPTWPVDQALHSSLTVLGFAWLVLHARRWPGLGLGAAFAVAVMLVMCTSLAYEWAEWGVALMLSAEAAEAYNGQQGDPWDAHMDMLLATAGALLAWPLLDRSGRAANP